MVYQLTLKKLNNYIKTPPLSIMESTQVYETWNMRSNRMEEANKNFNKGE